MKHKFALLAILLAASVLPSLCRAQTYSIDWFSIDGGGGTSTGGVYSVSGTIGQPDAGHMSGGNYTIDGGFWGIIAAVQTPGAPFLTITPAGLNVIISWPVSSTTFTLQQDADLNTPNAWSTTGSSVTVTNGSNYVTVPATVGNKFFRLKYP
ncbi:hypothetical protein [Pedosphaera parvula]|uniref:Uncharacterized protein n=1 Tax=Pedosphaera parvula (strain Ellin514) TaxID=320771 RepID=B9XRQ9_PEDPL|nr:hypothetical protein [Pedosphaera parvula]EEF57474.1 conserved hypothetical protein [Pedosphaera parvula Ellin514]